MCVERLASSLRMAMRRTARFLTRPVEAHFSQMSHHSPRLMRRVVDTPWSPRSQQRRLYTKQKSFFAGHKRNSSSRSLNDLDIDDDEDQEEEQGLVLSHSLGETTFRTTALSAAASACVFYYGAEFLVVSSLSTLTKTISALIVVVTTALTALAAYAFFAPAVVGLEKGPLDVFTDLWPEEREFFQKAVEKKKKKKQQQSRDENVIGQTVVDRRDDEVPPVPTQEQREAPVSPKASGAVLSSDEEGVTAKDAVRRCRRLRGEEDEDVSQKDPWMHVVTFGLDADADAIFDLYWKDSFYARFLNDYAKNKNATATDWTTDRSRTVTTLHPLATNIRIPGVSLVIPTVKSQRCFLTKTSENGGGDDSLNARRQESNDDDIFVVTDEDTTKEEGPLKVAIFERSKFESIPYADALRVEALWLYSAVANATKVRVYFRCLFIDKVLAVPKWMQRIAIAKTKGELHVTYAKWKTAVTEANSPPPKEREDTVSQETKVLLDHHPEEKEEEKKEDDSSKTEEIQKQRPKSTTTTTTTRRQQQRPASSSTVHKRPRSQPRSSVVDNGSATNSYKPEARKAPSSSTTNIFPETRRVAAKTFPNAAAVMISTTKRPEKKRSSSSRRLPPPPPALKKKADLPVFEDIFCFRQRLPLIKDNTPPKQRTPPKEGTNIRTDTPGNKIPDKPPMFARVVAPPPEFPLAEEIKTNDHLPEEDIPQRQQQQQAL